MGGISEVFEHIGAYKTVFSSLKNGSSLWDKSVLIFDKDELSDEHKSLFIQKFRTALGLEAYSADAYTFESTLLSDLRKTATLLSKLIKKALDTEVSEHLIYGDLTENYLQYGIVLRAKFNETFHKNTYYRYKNSKVEKTPRVFGQKVVHLDEHSFVRYVRNYFDEVLHRQEYFKLMDKYDVETVIKQTIDQYNLNFSIESDFIELIKLVDKSTWIAEWDFLNRI